MRLTFLFVSILVIVDCQVFSNNIIFSTFSILFSCRSISIMMMKLYITPAPTTEIQDDFKFHTFTVFLPMTTELSTKHEVLIL